MHRLARQRTLATHNHRQGLISQCKNLLESNHNQLHYHHHQQTYFSTSTLTSASFKPSAQVCYPRWNNHPNANNNNNTNNNSRNKQPSQEVGEENQEGEGEAPNEPSKQPKQPSEPTKPTRGKSKKSESSSSSNNNASHSTAPPAASSSSSGGNQSSSNSSSSSSSSGGHSSSSNSTSTTSISKPTVPEDYPQVLALPITRRPLFPGFYKAVVIKNPSVVAAIKEMMKRGQPYLGAFLLKEDNADSDVITNLNEVHDVGVFAQITSIFNTSSEKDGDDALTAVLYPHRRIRITSLIPPKDNSTGAPTQAQFEFKDNEKEHGPESSLPPTPPQTPTLTENEQDASAANKQKESTSTTSPFQTSFLQDFNISLVDVENLKLTTSSTPFAGGEGEVSSSSSSPSSTSSSTSSNQQPSQYVRAVASEIISVFKDIASLNPLFRDQIANFSMSQGSGNVFDQPEKLADFAAAVSSGETSELQDVLECMVLEDRMQKALVVLKKELMNAQLQSKISREVESKIQKRQREYYLMEQLKGIKKELGLESDGKDKMIEKFMERAKNLNMPDSVRQVFDEEINKLQHLEPAASEFNVSRNYLDWLTMIPWGKFSQENFDMASAIRILDEDHYGLKDVKDRILEFLAVGKLRGTVEGKILCLVGPPGVGKTSIGKSIARALNRHFYRFSVGGLSDVAEIKGHRRTYVGAMPGKIVQALKRVEVQNFLCLIDEIDKLNRGINGDPASALLEMLDPEQNNAFLDHYVDCPIDLSRVLFVCTANTLDTIPAPLLDRMEVLDVSGYVQQEKVAIATQYLAPQAKEGCGLQDAKVDLTPDAIESLIRYYCRESGVRKLKQNIEKIYRKAALGIVKDLDANKAKEEEKEKEGSHVDAASSSNNTAQSEEGSKSSEATSEKSEEGNKQGKEGVTVYERKAMDIPDSVEIKIDANNLVDYLGPAIYQRDRLYQNTTPAGVSMGLSYLGNGSGNVMPIEIAAMPGSGNIQLTGQLGEVLRESAQIALSFLKTHAFALGLTEKETDDLVANKNVHLHMPEGAVGKEGPSAGAAILTAFVSLFSNTGISSELAMTGEMTLAGQVLAIGGVKEKLLAAKRAGIKKVLVPMANKADIIHNVPDLVKEGLDIVYVEDVRQVLESVFKGRNDDLVSRLPKLPLIPQEESGQQ